MRPPIAMIVLTVSLALALPRAHAETSDPQPAPSQRFVNIVEPMIKAINRRDFPAVRKDFADVMLEAMPLDKAKPFFTGLLAQYGRILRLETPRFVPPNQAVIPAKSERGILDIKVVLDDDDKVIGLWFLPHTPALPVPEKNNTALELPFDGRWLVVWGGDTKELNQHHDVPCQRFAFDFLGLDSRGRTHKGDGMKNEDYFAFGRPILAPADGLVTDVIEGVRDNPPNSMNPYSALGNAVFIRHCPNEVSVLAHFKQNTIAVSVGQKVKKGQILGLCGNSGNSSEPHLHYHLQNTLIIQDATSIRCAFRNVTLERAGRRQAEAQCSPVKGDIVSPG